MNLEAVMAYFNALCCLHKEGLNETTGKKKKNSVRRTGDPTGIQVSPKYRLDMSQMRQPAGYDNK
jgi:hypothetical protein